MVRTSKDTSSSADATPELARGVASAAARKPYLRPTLQSYGKLVDVTHFGGSQLLDSAANLQNP